MIEAVSYLPFHLPSEAVNIHILCIQDKFKFCVEL